MRRLDPINMQNDVDVFDAVVNNNSCLSINTPFWVRYTKRIGLYELSTS